MKPQNLKQQQEELEKIKRDVESVNCIPNITNARLDQLKQDKLLFEEFVRKLLSKVSPRQRELKADIEKLSQEVLG